MVKKKKLKTKIAVFSFIVLFLSSSFLPSQLNAAPLITWDNPNSKGYENPFKISWDTVITADLLTQVVGCTGLTNKLARTILWTREKTRQFFKELLTEKTAGTVCRIVKGGSQTALGATPGVVSSNLPKGIDWAIDCGDVSNPTYDPKVLNMLKEQEEKEDQREFTRQCFNGIAFTLAKNQLTAIARNTINWINAGFDGNPLFVQSMRSVLGSVERNVIEPAIYSLADGAFPYGEMFSRSYINRMRVGVPRGSSMLSHLASNIADYVIVDYRDDPNLTASENQKRREEIAMEKFKDDFTEGGWNGWLSMTQIDANNPLGFYSAAADIISNTAEVLTQDARDEIIRGSGYRDQKECIEWQVYKKSTETPVIKEKIDPITKQIKLEYEFRKTEPLEDDLYGVCVSHKTITPGANIKDQMDAIARTPIEQLELADNINSVLNSVFSVLLYAIQNQGLPGLTSGNYTNDSSGKGIGVRSFYQPDLSSSPSQLGGSGYRNNEFSLTKDLGNTFIHEWNNESSLGDWDAHRNWVINPKPGDCFDGYGNKIECPRRLQKNTPPTDCIGDDGQKIGCPANVFYTVTVPGKTELMDGEYNGWAIGDRAFWDGATWQNWKRGQPNPVRNRGVLQLQKDFSIAAKELLSFLPGIMPKIGELDYCIPGPNPSWETVASLHKVSLIEIAASLNSDYDTSGNLLSRSDGDNFYMPVEGDKVYDEYLNLFKDLDGNLTKFWNEFVITSFKWDQIKDFSTLREIRRKDKDEKELIQRQADHLIGDISMETSSFITHYNEIINKNFGKGSLLWQEFLMREDTPILEKNPAFLPMISAGSKITGQMLAYDEEIKNLRKEVEEEIIRAESNIFKLGEIEKEVSAIIRNAQERRAVEMVKKIREEENNPNFSLDDFNRLFKECIKEENINYYDIDVIVSDTGNEAERCADGIDNDGDGFIDMDDIDCQFPLSSSGDSLQDTMNKDSGFGVGSDSGSYGSGYNTMTSGDTSSRPKVVENKDEVSSMGPLVIGKPVCSSFSFACSRGRVENKNEGKYKDTWTCLLNNAPDINNKEAWKKIGERETVGEDGEMIKEIDLYMVECKKYKEFSKGALMDASSDFYQSLLELEIDDSSVDFINAYFRKNKPNGVWEKVTYALTKWISSNNWTSEDFKDFTGEFGSTFKELTKEIGRLTLATAANDPVGKAIAIFNIIGAAARLLKMTFIDAFPAVKELMETIVDTFNEK